MFLVGNEDPLEITYSVAHVKEVQRAEEDLREPSQAECVGPTVLTESATLPANK